MGVIQEFKAFALRGNVIDLAVGVVIGGAFGKIVSSAVNDLLMPPIGKVLGGVNFADLFINLDVDKGPFASLAAARAAGAAVIAYGSFISTAIDFLIVAACIFAVIKILNTMTKKDAPAPVAPPPTKICPYCCTAIALPATRCPACTSELSK